MDSQSEYDKGEVRELVRICPYLPYMARSLHVKPELLEVIEGAEEALKGG